MDVEMLRLSVALQSHLDVRKHGKWPREAYNEMLSSVAKRFKSSQHQVKKCHMCYVMYFLSYLEDTLLRK